MKKEAVYNRYIATVTENTYDTRVVVELKKN